MSPSLITYLIFPTSEGEKYQHSANDEPLIPPLLSPSFETTTVIKIKSKYLFSYYFLTDISQNW